MLNLNDLLQKFTEKSREILGESLVGLYLHGSAAMGCFNPEKSDVDLIVVVNGGLSTAAKRRYMEMVVELNGEAPEKGIELSIVQESVCKPFVYPTPYELHFSAAHLDWYRTDPDGYIEKMNGTDKDLAAHFTVLYHRGKVLSGRGIKSVFGEVEGKSYMDSLWYDIEGAREDILKNPVYVALNLCRVLAYREEGLILSKKEGGEWGKAHLSEPAHLTLVCEALQEYETGTPMRLDPDAAAGYAEYMLSRIQGK